MVEVAFAGEGKEEDVKSENASTSLKVLLPWMIKQGMNLTKEQRGEVKQETKVDGSSAAVPFSDDKKTVGSDDQKNVQDEYVKAYYAALLKKQQEMAEAANKQPESSSMLTSDGSGTSSNRQVGMKSKHDEDEPDDDVDWEDAPIAGNTNEGYKVGDLNVEAEASGGDDDDVDWEEG
ncbi:uncharacterized protein LOC110812348 isoform X1 [Carica papaya]|uniref:uncharacterized protein LOC110812348 isoform X1 n=2 Tax=Carica papaya TaxID=3649 RepID=UPI000B8D0E85|nr:uncharacterized protein LOC110812348 isoform X1 [Carica papaya]